MGKQLTLLKSEVVNKRPPPVIVEFGGKERIASSKWNDATGCEYILREGVNKWISINELCRLAWGSANKANQKRIRAYIWRIRRHMILQYNMLLIADGRPTHSIKVYVGESVEERQLAEPMLKQMVKRKDFSSDICERAMNIYRGITFTSETV